MLVFPVRILKIMDDSGDNKLSKEELKYGLADYGMQLNLLELDGVFSYFDRNRDGHIDISEFLRGIRGDMNSRRKQLVLQAFDILDVDRSGTITVDEIRDRYDVSTMPEVRAGAMTPDQALKQFLNQWERADGDGIVTREEFLDYYTDLSALIDGDDYFELMIRNAWHIPGGSGWSENTANRRVLVRHADGREVTRFCRASSLVEWFVGCMCAHEFQYTVGMVAKTNTLCSKCIDRGNDPQRSRLKG